MQKPFRIEELAVRLRAITNLQLPEPPTVSPVLQRASLPRAYLEEALREDRLEMWYQPKIDLKSLTVCGAEALVRARDQTGDMIQPIDFLPPSGDPLYQPLSQFVMRRTMNDCTNPLRGREDSTGNG